MIFNIRGTSGSGKSHIIHSILKDHDHEEFWEVPDNPKTRVIGYSVPSLVTNVLGRYETVCGGCDQIGSQDEVCGKVNRLKHPNLIFEGLLVSHSFKRYHLLTKKVGPIVFCFLNTSPEQCIKRVYERRTAKGKSGTFNEGQIHKDWAAVDRCRQKFIEAGHVVKVLESENSIEEFLRVYNEYKRI